MIRVTENLKRVQASIRNAAEVAGRSGETVKLLAVSKRHSGDAIRQLAAAGQRDFGENYVDEALGKIVGLDDLGLTWHFIGALQSNKTRDVASHFDWVQTVDRSKLVRRLDAQRPSSLAPLNICIQVNIDDEPQKAGVAPADMLELAAAIEAAPRLRLRGLMAIPKPARSSAARRRPLRAMRALFAELGDAYPHVDTLSMGMSDDLVEAIEEGATMVRVGTALFGPRPSS